MSTSADDDVSAFMRAMDQQGAAVTGIQAGQAIPLAFEEFFLNERERLFFD